MALSTFGWDITTVTTVDIINEAINTPIDDDTIHPPEFDEEVAVMGLPLKVSGSWGDWLMSNQSDGKYAILHCLITEGMCDFGGTEYGLNKDATDGEYSWVDVEVNLDLIADDSKRWFDTSNKTAMVTSTTQCFKLMVSDDKAITVISSKIYNNYLNENGFTPGIESAFEAWFNDNKKDINMVFQVVLLGLTSAEGEYQWMQPSAYSYAAASSIDETNCAFGGLCLVDKKTDTSNLQQAVSLDALVLSQDAGGNAAYVISQEKFTEHVLMQCAVDLIKSSTEDDFTFNESGLSVTNNTAVEWQDFIGDDDEIVTPIIEKGKFTLSMGSDRITVHISGAHYRKGAHHTITMNVLQDFTFAVGVNGEGKPVFVVDNTESGYGAASVDVTITADPGIDIAQTVMGIIAGVAGLLCLGGAIAKCTARAGETVEIAAGANEATASMMNEGESIAYAAENTTAELVAPVAEATDGTTQVMRSPTLYNIGRVAQRALMFVSATTSAVWGGITIAEAVIEGEYLEIPSFEYIADSIAASIVFPDKPYRTLKTCAISDCFVVGVYFGDTP